MYNATLYLNSGFNAVNIPDSKATLDLAPTITVPAIDIYQARELSSFVVRALYANIKNADYLYLVNSEDNTDFAFYSIQNINMTSKDTAVLSVSMDYILTAGGASSLTFTDGMCERHHVATSSDTFGAYTEDDPYISPAETMLIEDNIPDFTGGESTDDAVIIETTVDLYGMYRQGLGTYTDETLLGLDYTSENENIVTVPCVKSVPYDFAFARMQKSGSNYYVTHLPDVSFFIANASSFNSGQTSGWVSDALSYVRSLGVESCIIAQYAIPYFMVSSTSYQGWDDGGTVGGVACGLVQYLTGARRVVSSGINFEHNYSSTVRNKRLYYGRNCEYTITSIASGNSASFLPEEIKTNSSSPSIEMRVDPRPSGCPYFRFDTYRGSSSTDLFFTNAVKGLNWQNVPLVYQGASGSLVNQYKYEASQASLYENANYGFMKSQADLLMNNFNSAASIAGDVMSGASSMIAGGGAGVGNALGAAANAATTATIQSYENNVTYPLLRQHQLDSYHIARNSELQSLLLTNKVVAPSMNFPISEGIRDFVGNTCIVYRKYYTENDVQRIDKILTMYGYRHTIPIEASLLTNRSKFNYIQARGVSIKDTGIPKWIRDGVSMQFAVGTRIWHQLPDTNAYTDGSNT